jgi:myo-inositol-1(or 4)-monophosphatase
MNWQRELDIAKRAAAAGGEVVARYFLKGGAVRSTKEGTSWNLVSDADVDSERAVVETIRAAFPDHAILGEEEAIGAADSEHLWVVDPLDGTNNFAHGIPHFAVSIGYRHLGDPKVGVVFNPIRGDLYTATRGGGAFDGDRRVTVAAETHLNEVFVGVGFYYDRGLGMERTLDAIRDLFHAEIHGIRRFGTASLDLVQVGLGWFGAYFEYELRPWDFAAGQLFVEEAGGLVTTARGAPLPLAKTSVVASNGPLHEAVLAITRRHHPE